MTHKKSRVYQVAIYGFRALTVLVISNSSIAQTDIDVSQYTSTPFDSSPVTEHRTPSGDWRIDGLIKFQNSTNGRKWGGPVGTGAIITYSFPQVGAVWAGADLGLGVPYYSDRQEPYVGFEGFNDLDKSLARAALKLWEDVANVKFIEVQESENTVGSIRFGWTEQSNFTAHSSSPSELPRGADVWFNQAYKDFHRSYGHEKPQFTCDISQTTGLFVHEIGHSLGLNHDGSGDTGLREYDNKSYTVMSYNANGLMGCLSQWGKPMQFDILAIEYLYGKKNGDNTPVVGDYTFYGSSKSDHLVGLSGNDNFNGYAGNDTFVAGGGNDFVNGGSGVDTITFNKEKSFYNVGNNWVNSADGNVNFSEVERLEFTDKKVAFDLSLDGSAGKAARIIGAAFGKSFITPEYTAAAIGLFDSGYSLVEVSQMIIDFEPFQSLVGSKENAALINIIFKNVLGRNATSEETGYYKGLLVGDGGAMTQAQLLVLAAENSLNEASININSLLQTGVEY